MKDLEERLRELPLREAPSQLDERVMRQKPERPSPSPVSARRLPAWATLAVAIVMGAAGFGAGAAWRDLRPAEVVPPSPVRPARVQVIYNAPTLGNPFDFTMASDIFPAGKMKEKVAPRKGEES